MTSVSSVHRPRLAGRIAAAVALAFALVVGGAAVPANAAGGTLAASLTSGPNGSYLNNEQMSVHVWKLNGGTWVDQGAFYPGGLGLILVSNRDPGTYRIEFVPPNGSPYAYGWYGIDNTFTFQESQAKQFVVTAAGEFHNFDTAVPARGSIRTNFVDPTQPNGFPPPFTYQIKLWRLVDDAWVHWNGSYGLGGFGDANFAQLTNLPAGTYTLSYIDQRTTPDRYVDQWYRGEPNLENATRITLGDFENRVLDTVTLIGPAFSDVAPGQTFATEINWMLLQGISTGNLAAGVRTYDPIAEVSRQAMAAFLYRAAGSPTFSPPAVATFSDVPTNHFFYQQIEWMKAEGITNGLPDGTFAPNDSVSREAMAAFLYRFSGSPAFTAPGTATFSDYPVGSLFFKEVEWLKSTGITTGNADGTYAPIGAVSRQAMAAFLFRQADLAIAE